MKTSSVLISGAGIAGTALAHWLLRYGFTPTLVERADRHRGGGYIIDFWGVGYDILEKMGLLPVVLEAGYAVSEVRMVDRRGARVGGFDASVFRRATNGRYTSLARGDLATILHRSVEDRAEIIFGDEVTAVEEHRKSVLVRFRRSPARRFDLVVGADGLHSGIRRLQFGPESEFERPLGYTVAAFALPDYRPRDEGVYVVYGVPRRQVGRFAMRGGRTMFLLVAAEDAGGAAVTGDRAAQEAYLKARFSTIGGESSRIIDQLPLCGDLYFDRVSQIRMDRWWKGRTALLGDAAFAPSLLAGQGAALAIFGAYVLAGELAGSAGPQAAFARYENLMRAFIADKQAAAERFAGSFAPKTRLGLVLRNAISNALQIPFVADLAIGRTLQDRISIPDYAALEKHHSGGISSSVSPSNGSGSVFR